MKKVLLTICLVFFTIVPAFCAAWELQQARQEFAQGAYSKCLSTLNTAILNSSYKDAEMYKLRAKTYMKMNSPVSAIKDFDTAIEISPSPELYEQRAYAHLKVKQYDKAYVDFMNTADKSNGGKPAIKGLKLIANDSNAPTSVRYSTLYSLAQVNKALYGNGSAEHLIPILKGVQLITNAKEDDEVFIKAKMSKQELINKARDGFTPSSEEGKAYTLGQEVGFGYCEYALGNKELGKKIAYGALAEAKTQKVVSEVEIREIENIVAKVFQALDTPGI